MTVSIYFRSALVAVVTAAIFLAVDWTTLFPFAFPDLNNYRSGFQSGWYVFSTLNLGWVSFILSEGVWVYGFDALWRWTGDIDNSFFIVSAVSLFLTIYYIYFRTKSVIAVLFIINPAFINLVVEQLRSGLGTGLFFVGLLVKSRMLQAAIFLLALSVHSAFFLFVAFYYAVEFSERFNITKLFNTRPVLLLVLFFVLATVIAYFRDFALAAVGDTRAFIVEDQTSGVFLAVGWLLFLVSYSLLRPRGRAFNFDLYFFTLNIFMFIASIFMGSYGARFVAIAIPALAVMSSHLEGRERTLFYVHYFLFSAVYFTFWLGR
ncbi:EpsG family protein [Leptolyngbya sp. 15MV]|nr:EpsG family protein [Leptolyngbya sp. 15MV]